MVFTQTRLSCGKPVISIDITGIYGPYDGLGSLSRDKLVPLIVVLASGQNVG